MEGTKWTWKDIVEWIGIAGIIFSVGLVAYELRQNSAVAMAQAVTDLNAAVDNAYRVRAQYPELDRLIVEGHKNLAALSEREASQLFAWIRADMNLLEAAWFQYDNGVIPDERFDGFINSICGRVTSDAGRVWWSAEKEFFPRVFQSDVDKWCFEA